MKLSEHIQELERGPTADTTFILTTAHIVLITLYREKDNINSFNTPILYELETTACPVTSREKLILLAPFEAMFHDAMTPLTP
jgi:hypothetical protein